MELTVKVKLGNTPTMRRVAQAAQRMGEFEAQVLLRRDDITVNAKSLMGLLSLGLRDGMGVTIIAHGEDEAQAVCEMAGTASVCLHRHSDCDKLLDEGGIYH